MNERFTMWGEQTSIALPPIKIGCFEMRLFFSAFSNERSNDLVNERIVVEDCSYDF